MDTNDMLPLGLESLSIRGLAAYLGVPEATLRDGRVDGKGPLAIRIGGQVRFAPSPSHTELDDYVACLCTVGNELDRQQRRRAVDPRNHRGSMALLTS
jgi:hypothetical protein